MDWVVRLLSLDCFLPVKASEITIIKWNRVSKVRKRLFWGGEAQRRWSAVSIVRNLVELDRANQASLRRGRNQSAVETETETETAAAIRIPLAIRILLSLDILVCNAVDAASMGPRGKWQVHLITHLFVLVFTAEHEWIRVSPGVQSQINLENSALI